MNKMDMCVQENGVRSSTTTADRDIESLNNVTTMTNSNSNNGPVVTPVSAALTKNRISFSPASRRKRLRNISKRNIDALLGISPTRHAPRHIPRDPIQPSSGSITDVHNDASPAADDEEADFFSENATSLQFRARSNTCPENRVFQRKARVQNRNRPLTPPPGGADDSELENRLARMSVKEKLGIVRSSSDGAARDAELYTAGSPTTTVSMCSLPVTAKDELGNYIQSVVFCGTGSISNGQRTISCDIVDEEDENVFTGVDD